MSDESGKLTNFITKQKHLTPMLIDGFIFTMIPTLTFVASQLPDGKFKTSTNAAVVFFGALSAFRSKVFGNWQEEKKKISETEYLRRSLERQENLK